MSALVLLLRIGLTYRRSDWIAICHWTASMSCNCFDQEADGLVCSKCMHYAGAMQSCLGLNNRSYETGIECIPVLVWLRSTRHWHCLTRHYNIDARRPWGCGSYKSVGWYPYTISWSSKVSWSVHANYPCNCNTVELLQWNTQYLLDANINWCNAWTQNRLRLL